MKKLERVLASGVLGVLRERAHVALAPTRGDALCDELEAALSPAVTKLVESVISARSTPARGNGARHAQADDSAATVDELAAQLAARVTASDHVDDIFATDHVIRRDTRRVLLELVTSYLDGALEVEREDEEETISLPLLELGYIVAEVTKRVDPGLLRDALERAAATVGGRLTRLTDAGVANFELPGRAESQRLSLEEAVTKELVTLIDAELVDLPSVEQVLELADVDCTSPDLELAIERSLIRTRTEFDCVVQCVSVDESTIIVTLTPLSGHAADHADDAFTMFIETLEEELTTPSRLSGLMDPTPDESPEPSSRPTSSRRKRKEANAPPRSRPRNRRGAPRAESSSTRQMREAKKRKAK